MRKISAAILAGILMVGSTWAGPIIIDGSDSYNHGNVTSGLNTEGWAYMQRSLQAMATQIGPGVAKVVVDLGSSVGPSRNAINSAFSLSTLPSQGWSLRHVDGAAQIDTWLGALSTANSGILYIPPASFGTADLDASELTAINGRAAEIDLFVSAGGGVFAQAESDTLGPTAFGWLTTLVPTITMTQLIQTNGATSALTLTAAGKAAFPTLTSASLTTGPWHQYFEGNLGGLKVLATAPDPSGTVRNVIIGGGAGTRFTVPTGGVLPVTRPPAHPFCITRNPKFWYTHDSSDDPLCVTLQSSIDANGGSMGVGNLRMPSGFRDADSVTNSTDAVIEALSYFWMTRILTGEDSGTQNALLPSSALCQERKRLVKQLIPAIANNVLLGTTPNFCTYFNGLTTTNFPADLIDQAGVAAAGDDIVLMKTLRVLLAKFNRSGTTNNFFGEIYECSPTPDTELMSRALDPNTQANCGASLNDTCATGQPFSLSILPYTAQVELRGYSNDFANASCATGGRDAVWIVRPPTAVPGRQFTVDTLGSNFNTVISVWRGGACSEDGTFTGGIQVACNDNNVPFTQAKVSFKTNGSSTYYIVVEGLSDAYGLLKVKITSP